MKKWYEGFETFEQILKYNPSLLRTINHEVCDADIETELKLIERK